MYNYIIAIVFICIALLIPLTDKIYKKNVREKFTNQLYKDYGRNIKILDFSYVGFPYQHIFSKKKGYWITFKILNKKTKQKEIIECIYGLPYFNGEPYFTKVENNIANMIGTQDFKIENIHTHCYNKRKLDNKGLFVDITKENTKDSIYLPFPLKEL